MRLLWPSRGSVNTTSPCTQSLRTRWHFQKEHALRDLRFFFVKIAPKSRWLLSCHSALTLCETLELQWDTMPAVMRLAITPPPSVSPFTLRIWACSVCLSVLGLRWSGVCGRGLSLHISTVPFTVPRKAAQKVRMKWVYLSKKVFLG